MITDDEIKVLNHIIEDMEDHPECISLSSEEMDKILEEYDQITAKAKFQILEG
ncbi:MAG: hypothetical protein JRI61_09900 [Deltaproteobacteria bacterium]|nr:hypothetical protein [Deltaproteobacteria bacterium]